MKSRNKLTRRVNCVGAALVVALFYITVFCGLLEIIHNPMISNAAVVDVTPPVSQWNPGYYQSTGTYVNQGYLDNARVTSPQSQVITGVTYFWRMDSCDSPTMLINEFDAQGYFLRRTSKPGQLTGSYTPGSDAFYISFTVATFDIPGYSCRVWYDSASADYPNGTEQIWDDVHYGGDGDFYSVGDEKALTYYKYLPDEDLKYIRVEAVNNYGQRLKYRIVGYIHGTEVFRSGLAEYGENVDIQDANFDYYNIYLINRDDENQPVPVQYIQSFRYIYGIRYYVYAPTEPPGVSEEIEPTEYVDLNGLDWYIPTAPVPDSSVSGALSLISSVNDRLFSAFPIYTTAAGVAFLCWLLWLANRRDDE